MSMSMVCGDITFDERHNAIFTEAARSAEEFERRWGKHVHLQCDNDTWVQFNVRDGKLSVEWGEPAA